MIAIRINERSPLRSDRVSVIINYTSAPNALLLWIMGHPTHSEPFDQCYPGFPSEIVGEPLLKELCPYFPPSSSLLISPSEYSRAAFACQQITHKGVKPVHTGWCDYTQEQ